MGCKSVAVDGPSGAGKSTMAKKLAERLNYRYVDTGAIYRTLGLFALRNGVAPENAPGVTALLDRLQIAIEYGEDGLQHMLLDGEDVTAEIRGPEISKYTSSISAIPAVRSFLLSTQRNMSKTHNIIMDGRDIGTVVLPDADVKIFLTATAEDRARRRYEEFRERGIAADFDTVLRDIRERDRRDTTRDAAPLRQAEDAILVDTTGNSLEQSFETLLEAIRRKLNA